MVVYANLAGKWIELGDNDYIEDEPAEIFANFKLEKENFRPSNNFLKISHGTLTYNVHISQIQWASDNI